MLQVGVTKLSNGIVHSYMVYSAILLIGKFSNKKIYFLFVHVLWPDISVSSNLASDCTHRKHLLPVTSVTSWLKY